MVTDGIVPGSPMAIQDLVNGPNFSGQSRAFGTSPAILWREQAHFGHHCFAARDQGKPTPTAAKAANQGDASANGIHCQPGT